MEDFIVINQIGLYDLQVLLYKYCSKLWKKIVIIYNTAYKQVSDCEFL